MSVKIDQSKYRVFPRTYLQTVSFKVMFEDIDESCLTGCVNFFKEVFGIDISPIRLSNLASSPLRFGNPEHTVQWELTASSLCVTIDQEAYTSFSTTLLPLIKVIEKMLEAISRSTIEFILDKVNLIPRNIVSMEEMRSQAHNVFSDTITTKWDEQPYQSSAYSILYQSKIAADKCSEIEIIDGFIVEPNPVKSRQPSRYVLDLNIHVKLADCNQNSFTDCVTTSNLKLFNEFISCVTDTLIMSMGGGEHE